MTITYRYTDATDSPMFSLAPILPISDVRIGLTLALVVFVYVSVVVCDCRRLCCCNLCLYVLVVVCDCRLCCCNLFVVDLLY